MQHFYSWLKKPLLVIVVLFTLHASVKAQLNTGDLVFTGYQASGPTTNTDQFAFVTLVNLAPGTVIKFTDNGWTGAALGTTECIATFTVGATTITAGRELRIILGPPAQALHANGATAGTVVVSGTISIASTGDQVFAYQGPDNVPTVFIAGIQMNTDAGSTAATWDPSYTGNGNSVKPAALTSGTTAFYTNPERDNGKFSPAGGCGSVPLATAAQVRSAVNNPANWIFEDGAVEPSYGSPLSGCRFLGLNVLPVKLESFSGKLNSDKTITLQWKVAEQQDVQNYILEESTDGVSFTTLSTVPPQATETSYTYTDVQVNSGKNFYRLKTTELSGKITYSNIIVINLKAGIVISVYPNPVKDKLTIQQFGTAQNRTATLSDGQGKVLLNIKLNTLQQTISMERYATGIYVLKLDDGTTYKIVKE